MNYYRYQRTICWRHGSQIYEVIAILSIPIQQFMYNLLLLPTALVVFVVVCHVSLISFLVVPGCLPPPSGPSQPPEIYTQQMCGCPNTHRPPPVKTPQSWRSIIPSKHPSPTPLTPLKRALTCIHMEEGSYDQPAGPRSVPKPRFHPCSFAYCEKSSLWGRWRILYFD